MFTSRHPFLSFSAALVLLLIGGIFFWPSGPLWEASDSQESARSKRVGDRVSGVGTRVPAVGGEEQIFESEVGRHARAKSSDSAPNRVVEADGNSEKKSSGIGTVDGEMEVEERGRITGLRARLLMEAAERALHSSTPWSDLSVVALAFARAGDHETARYWFSRAGRLAQDPDDPRQASQAMREVVKSLVQGKYLDEAAELITRIPNSAEKARAQSELVRAFAGKGNFEEARTLTASLSDRTAKGVALRYIAEFEARLEGVEEARQTIGMIADQKLRDEAFSRVASILASKGKGDGAMMLVNQIKDQRVRDVALTRIASLQSAGSGLSAEALTSLIQDPFFRDEALRSMVAKELDRRKLSAAELTANSIRNDEQRAKAYEALVMLQLRYGDVRGALERAQSIHAEEPRFRALQAVAVTQTKESGAAGARNIANLIGDREMRDETYRKIACRAAQIGKSRGAVDTIAYIVDPGERAMALATIALTQAQYGDDRFARSLVGSATREIDETTSQREAARATGLLAEVHAETGDASSAFEVASSINNSGLRDMTYQKIAVRFARSKEPQLAEQSANMIQRDLTRERALDSVAQVLAGGVSAANAIDMASRLEGRRQQVRFLVSVAGRKS